MLRRPSRACGLSSTMSTLTLSTYGPRCIDSLISCSPAAVARSWAGRSAVRSGASVTCRPRRGSAAPRSSRRRRTRAPQRTPSRPSSGPPGGQRATAHRRFQRSPYRDVFDRAQEIRAGRGQPAAGEKRSTQPGMRTGNRGLVQGSLAAITESVSRSEDPRVPLIRRAARRGGRRPLQRRARCRPHPPCRTSARGLRPARQLPDRQAGEKRRPEG